MLLCELNMPLNLSTIQQRRLLKTVSSSSLYYLALNALELRRGFSIVRMADGEKHLYDLILENSSDDKLLPGIKGGSGWMQDDKWLKYMGLYGISLRELKRRMDYAALKSTFFAPSPSAFDNSGYDVYDYWPEPEFYGEHFFNCIWGNDKKEILFKTAGHVLCIHGNAGTADSMQIRGQGNLGVKVSYLKLNDWIQTDEVIAKAKTCTAPLILFSGGPSGKYIGPALANVEKVVLDIGHQMDKWTLSHLPMNRPAAEEFHREWSKNNQQWIK
jgi:hypothetical protein